jgi:hypothetical protein
VFAQNTQTPPAQPPASPQDAAKSSTGASGATRKSRDEDQHQLAPGEDPNNRLLTPFLSHIVGDQKQFWTSPKYWGVKDLKWTLPLAAMTGGLIAGDHWITQQVPDKPNQLNTSKNISDYTTYGLIAGGGGAFLLGTLRHDDHMKEAGLLSGEAAINATGVTYLFKVITQRPRPLQSDGNGTFFTGGYSFPSEHSAIAWSIASVFAHEYPGWLSQTLAYGAASAVTVTRLTAKQHFSSDVMIGSILGWYFGRQVYRAHHDPDLPGAAWGNFYDLEGDQPRDPGKMGSPYVPLDSWIYPALDRLAARGYITSAISGMRPWTRRECTRQLQEVVDTVPESAMPPADLQIYQALTREFAYELDKTDGQSANLNAKVDTLYTRILGISGPVINDSFHFGQTFVNDFGRPYYEGFNAVTGFQSYAVGGPFSLFVRGEYQHTPTIAAQSVQYRQIVAGLDLNPVIGPAPPNEINQFNLIEAYAGYTWKNNEISVGRQNLWWGPGQSGPMMFSNNAEALWLLNLNRVEPIVLPWFFKYLGPLRAQFFFGRVAGHYFPNGPFLHGAKISFKPTQNLELGFSRTVLFAGEGHPLTWRSFWRSFISVGDNPNSLPGSSQDVGDRRSSFDFQYRLPKLRKYVTLYTDSLADDDPSPLANPPRAGWNPGIYFTQFPFLPKLDLRVESVYTDVPAVGSKLGQFIYINGAYHDGYTNRGNLVGSWIGREARGYQGWSNYWFSATNKVEFMYRTHQVSPDFYPQGGRIDDYRLTGQMLFHSKTILQLWGQYENWKFPIIEANQKSNFTVALQVEFHPQLEFWKRKAIP